MNKLKLNILNSTPEIRIPIIENAVIERYNNVLSLNITPSPISQKYHRLEKVYKKNQNENKYHDHIESIHESDVATNDLKV